jgi:hypothetical protein
LLLACFIGTRSISAARWACFRGARDVVEVLGLDGDDVVVVAELAGLGGEAEICDGGDGDVCFWSGEGEAVCPGAFGFVVEVEG